MDSLDGKHARNTKLSSPLGMIFDHGCDAISTIFISNCIGSILALETANWFLIIWLMIIIPFFLATLEEYYTGELNFPEFHGVSEGTLIACFAMSMTGFYGRDMWVKNHFNIFGTDVQLNHIIVFTSFLAGIGFGANSLVKICKNYQGKRQEIFNDCIVFAIFFIVCPVINVNYSNSIMVHDCHKIITIIYGFSFAKVVGHLQLSHILDCEFNPLRKSLILSIGIMGVFCISNYFAQGHNSYIDYVLLTMLSLHVVEWVHFAYNVTEELCEILGINRLTVVKRIKSD